MGAQRKSKALRYKRFLIALRFFKPGQEVTETVMTVLGVTVRDWYTLKERAVWEGYLHREWAFYKGGRDRFTVPFQAVG